MNVTTITIKMPADLKNLMDEAAWRLRTSMSQFVRDAVSEKIKKESKG